MHYYIGPIQIYSGAEVSHTNRCRSVWCRSVPRAFRDIHTIQMRHTPHTSEAAYTHTQLYLVQKRRQQFLLLSMTCDEKFLWINFFHHYYYYQSINVNNLTQTFIIKPRQLPIHHRSVSCADCVGLCQLISFSARIFDEKIRSYGALT